MSAHEGVDQPVDQAREHLRTAEDRFRTLGLPRWLDLVAAELNALA